MRALLWVSLSYARRHLLQTCLMLLGIAVGVSVVVAIDLATSSARSSFVQASETIAGRATHAIVGVAEAGPSVELYRRLRVGEGRRDIAPVLEGYITLEEPVRHPVRVLGVDPFAEGPFRDWVSVGGGAAQPGGTLPPGLTAAASASGPVDPLGALSALLTTPRGVLVSRATAARYGWGVGHHLAFHRGGQQGEVVVVGLLDLGAAASGRSLDDLMLCDLAAAQEILGTGDRLTRIDARLPDAATQRSLAAALPSEVRLAPQGERRASVQQLTAAFELNLRAISLLALVVGVFLVYNTVTFFVVQRRPAMGILRALGATREQIFAQVVVETLALSAVGSLAGLVLGVALGRGALHLVTRTINDLYYTLPSSTYSLRASGLLQGLLAGLGAGLVAAVPPALEASRTQPVGAMRASTLEAKAASLLWGVTVGGFVVLCAGIVALAWPGDELVLGLVGLVLSLVGCAALAPVATVAAMRLLEPLTVSLCGVVGKLAPRSVVRSLSRTGVAVAALMLAVSAIVGVQIMVGSFRTTFVEWLDGTLGADVFVSSPSSMLGRSDGFDAEVARRVAQVSGVARVASESHFTLESRRYGPVQVVGVSHDITRHRRFVWLDGSEADAGTTARRLEAGEALVSQPFAFRHHLLLKHGLEIELDTAQGPRRYLVAGVYYDYGSERGTVLLGLSSYRRAFPATRLDGVAVSLAPGANLDEVCERIRAALAPAYDLRVLSNRALRQQALDIFERTFAITSALRVLVAVVAFVGVLSCLMALMLERRREVATLRALGLTVEQLQRMMLLETLLLSGVAGVLALPVGTLLAVVLVEVINPRSFGWTMAFVPRPEYYAEAWLLAMAAGLLAGVYPAWRFARSASPRELQVE